MYNALPTPFIEEPAPQLITQTGITFQRKARWAGLNMVLDPETGALVVVLTIQFRHFATLPDGTAGALADDVMAHRLETFRASNAQAVDLSTEQVVFTRVQETEAEFIAMLEADPRPLALRGRAFLAKMHAGPIGMLDMLREAIQTAVA